jgi:hypothetical protein
MALGREYFVFFSLTSFIFFSFLQSFCGSKLEIIYSEVYYTLTKCQAKCVRRLIQVIAQKVQQRRPERSGLLEIDY